MRGVHRIDDLEQQNEAGSSPHARGPRGERKQVGANARIIPACAGSTIGKKYLATREQDHPRMRGVHTSMP